MSDKEKLVELLNKANSACVGTDCFEGCRFYMENDCLYKLMADHLISNGVTVQEWISVKDRLPEMPTIHKRYRHMYMKSIRVLCVCVQKDGKTMVKEGYCELWDDYPEPIWKIPGTIDSVTHWMPLPQPPKGE